MGCQSSKEDITLSKMKQRKEDEIRYQNSLKKLEKYIREHNIKLKYGGYYVRIGRFRLDEKKFNSRNVSQISISLSGDRYPRFCPKQDQDLTDPKFK